MNELEQILGIQSPKNIKISSVVNTTDKVIKDSIFFGLQGTRVHGSRYADKALELGASLVIHNDPDFISKHKNIFYIKDLNDKLILNSSKELEIRKKIDNLKSVYKRKGEEKRNNLVDKFLNSDGEINWSLDIEKEKDKEGNTLSDLKRSLVEIRRTKIIIQNDIYIFNYYLLDLKERIDNLNTRTNNYEVKKLEVSKKSKKDIKILEDKRQLEIEEKEKNEENSYLDLSEEDKKIINTMKMETKSFMNAFMRNCQLKWKMQLRIK
jgi:hypothetical protein